MTNADGIESVRTQPPTAIEIEGRFRSAPVSALRPVLLGGLWVSAKLLRYDWSSEGAERLLEIGEPMILASNHCSHADTGAILGTLPGDMRRRTCVAAALDVFGSVEDRSRVRTFRRECLQTAVATAFFAFAFDRSGPPLPSVRTAVTLVRNGWNLLLYPEGTRSRTGKVSDFKAGVSLIAKLTGRRVVPIHVSGGKTIMPIGTKIPGPGHANVRYGEPIELGRGESLLGFATRLRHHVQSLAAGRDVVAGREPSQTEPAPRLAAVEAKQSA